jgi:hypothetical protein
MERKIVKVVRLSALYREKGVKVPFLRLSGKWLERYGFKVGDIVAIVAEDGVLTISKIDLEQEAFNE